MTSIAVAAYERYVAALVAKDLDAVVASYTADAVPVDSARIGPRHDHIRAVSPVEPGIRCGRT